MKELEDMSRVELEQAYVETRARESVLRRRFEGLETFAGTLARGLATERSGPNDLLRMIAQATRLAMNVEYAALGVGTDPDRPFTPWACSGVSRELGSEADAAPRPAAMFGETARSGTTVLEPALLTAAVRERSVPIGQLYVANKCDGTAFDADDQLLLEVFAARAGLALEIARLGEVARTAVSTRDNVLAVVSHDLRNPLSNIKLATRILTNQLRNTDPVIVRSLDLMIRASSTMTWLVEDLLQAASFEAGFFAIKPEHADVRSLVQEALDAVTSLAAIKAIEVTSEVGDRCTTIWCDRKRLLQVLVNLLGNAVKFCSDGARVGVHADVKANEVTVSVIDNGPGIAEEQRERLFERFVRGDDDQGVGLGLHIAKVIVEAHGGRIWVETSPSGGATFSFTVPTAPS